MLTKNDLGQNIKLATDVLLETYKNLNALFIELDAAADGEGFIPLSPKFLRWKSDASPEGWLIRNFIKLYQKKDFIPLKHLPDMNEGDLFCVEIILSGEEDYPVISLAKISYDYSKWTRVPGVSDRWVFWNIFRDDKFFDIKEKDGVWTSKPRHENEEKYWGVQEASGIHIPLITIDSPEKVKSEIFKRLCSL